MSHSDPAPQPPGQPQPQVPQYAQPQATQYAPPQHQPQGAQGSPYPTQATAGTNVLGIIALAILLLSTLWGMASPFVFHQLIMGGATYTIYTVSAVIQGIAVLIALGLAIGGVLQKRATRLRWAAVGSLVAASLSLLGILGSFLFTALVPFLY